MRAGYTPPPVNEPAFWTIGSHDLRHVERPGGTSSLGTSTAWVSGLAVYVPFTMQNYGTVYEWWYQNGTLTTAHNFDVGIYREDFTKVQSLGSTAGLTVASVINQTTTWTDLTLAPGSYYMAFANDSTRTFQTTADLAGFYQAFGCVEQTGVGSTLPNPMVPVTYTRAFLPDFGMNFRSVAL